jgi:hypothetical protein
MPSFNTEVPHALTQEQASERLRGLLEKVRQRYQDQVSNMKEEWQDNVLNFSFTTYGFSIGGALTVEPSVVKLNGNLPFAAVPFRGKIEQSIRSEIEKVLS